MINKKVLALMDGGWKISGEIIKKEDDRFFIKNKDEVYMVFKSKISAMLLDIDEKNIEEPLNSKMAVRYHNNREFDMTHPPGRTMPEHEDLTGGVSLPSDILIDNEDLDSGSDNDFSISFKNNSGNIEITSEED